MTIDQKEPPPLVDKDRLVAPDDKFKIAFSELGFTDQFQFEIDNQSLLLIDPTYIADVYNSADEVASFLRAHAVFLMNFGGDVSCPALWAYPYVKLPISAVKNPAFALQEAEILADEIGCDSGSFMLLPFDKSLPFDLNTRIQDLISKANGALLQIPNGTWKVFYEQFDAPQENMTGLYRNIVLALQGDKISE